MINYHIFAFLVNSYTKRVQTKANYAYIIGQTIDLTYHTRNFAHHKKNIFTFYAQPTRLKAILVPMNVTQMDDNLPSINNKYCHIAKD